MIWLGFCLLRQTAVCYGQLLRQSAACHGQLQWCAPKIIQFFSTRQMSWTGPKPGRLSALFPLDQNRCVPLSSMSLHYLIGYYHTCTCVQASCAYGCCMVCMCMQPPQCANHVRPSRRIASYMSTLSVAPSMRCHGCTTLLSKVCA